jgi:lipopolysaccharide/colanic/teichoic acid biosynthesis glycosyltransferase
MSSIAADDFRGAPPQASPALPGVEKGRPEGRGACERMQALEIHANPISSLEIPLSTRYTTSKTILDIVFALLLLVVTSPLVILAVVLVRLTSRGPAVYTQTRLGKYGYPFVIYKLRTMVHQCESLTGACWSLPDDPRITKLGRFLRKTHIDELPQIWNVLKGEMSLVGPRPERPEFIPQLEQAIPNYRARLLLKPGVTGLAQVQLPPDTNLASVRMKLAYDLYYFRNASIWLDLRILACTAVKLVGLSFGAMRYLFCLPKQDKVEREYKLLAQDDKHVYRN